MRLTSLFLLAGLLQVSAKGISQTVTLSVKNESLKKVADVIEKQTKYQFIWYEEALSIAKPVSINIQDMPLDKALTLCFKDQPISYTIQEKYIVISRKLPAVDLPSEREFLNATNNIDIHGRVLNENAEPLAGASISVKGTDLVSIADEKGYYTISNVPEGEYTLIVTYVGYKSISKQIKLTNNTIGSINFELETNPYGFNGLIISANLVASKKREVASAVTTITAKQIERLPISNVTELFRGEIPGGNSWNLGPGNAYNSIKLRGDIDFYSSSSTVKVFIDGIEVADATLLSTLPLSSIDHIEVLHGPQASTLYGSGATSGVVSIFTKKGKAGGPHINAKISAGTIASKWVEKTPYQQDHSLNIFGGSDGISYNIGGSYFHYDPYWGEGGNNTNSSGFGSVKARQGNFTMEFTGQYSIRKFGLPLNPIQKDSLPTVPAYTVPFYISQTQVEQILGVNIIYKPFNCWQHNLSVGIDQNNSSSIQTNPRYIYAWDTLNSIVNGNQSKKSFRYYSTLQVPISNFLKATLTAGLDHFLFEHKGVNTQGIGIDPNFSQVGTASTSYQKYSNTGYYAQAVFGVNNKFFLTTGVRSEFTSSFGKSSGSSVAPRIGASVVLDMGNIMIKPRIGYGKSIKVPNPSQFVEQITVYPTYTYHLIANPNLKPQEQTGYDIGFDAEFAKGIGTFEATYYNQNVDNFITNIYDFSNYPPVFGVQYINVGKIKNSGWELAGTLNLENIKFRFTYSVTNSKVAHIANTGYEAYYQNGDRIWGIPKSSGGATFTYSFPALFKSSSSMGGSISLGATYFGEWVNMDQLSQLKDYNIYFDYSKTNRDYAIKYPGYALFRLGVNYSINKNFEAFLSINNLFNSFKFESDNTIPTQGRVSMLGIHINY